MATLPINPDPNAPQLPPPVMRLLPRLTGGDITLLPPQTSLSGTPMARVVPQTLNAPTPASLSMNAAPDLGAPTAASPRLLPSAPGARLGADQSRLSFLQRSGPGVDQIAHPVDAQGNPTNQPVGFGRHLLSILGHTGDIALSAVAPGIAELTPGTTLHNNLLQRQASNRIGEDQGELQKGAQLQQTDANTRLLDVQPQIKMLQAQNAALLNGAKIDHYGAQDEHLDAQNDNYANQYHANLAKSGFAVDETDPSGQRVRPLRYEEMSPVQQATEDLKHSQAEQAEAGAALKKAQNDPSSPAYRLAASRVAVANRNASTAQQRLSLYGQSLDMRRENMNANLYGTGPDGQALPGAVQIQGDDGNLQTVGLRAGNTAARQQGKVVSFNDLQGSAAHTRQAIEELHAVGGSLSDPTVVAAMHDPTSIMGKIVNGKLVKPNLSQQQIQAIGALNQLREQIGIMRATTGGPAAEAQAQRMLSALPEAGDSQGTATNKLDELDGVLTRLRPGAVHVAGGQSVQGQPRASVASRSNAVPPPTTHAFSLGAWQRANPKGDTNAARQAAMAAGYTVVQ